MEWIALEPPTAGFRCRLAPTASRHVYVHRDDAIKDIKESAVSCGFKLTIRSSRAGHDTYLICSMGKKNGCKFEAKTVNEAGKGGREGAMNEWKLQIKHDMHNHPPDPDAKPQRNSFDDGNMRHTERTDQALLDMQRRGAATSSSSAAAAAAEWMVPRTTQREAELDQISALSDPRSWLRPDGEGHHGHDGNENDGDDDDSDANAAAVAAAQTEDALDHLSRVGFFPRSESPARASPIQSAQAQAAAVVNTIAAAENAYKADLKREAARSALFELMHLPLQATLQGLDETVQRNRTEGEMIQHRIRQMLVEVEHFRRGDLLTECR